MPRKETDFMTEREYLCEILRSTKRQERMNRTRLTVQLLTSVLAAAAIVVAAVYITRTLRPIVEQVSVLSATVNTLAGDTSRLIKELNSANLGETVTEARAAISQAAEGMQQAVDGIGQINFGALNTSIESLNTVVSALTSIFKR